MLAQQRQAYILRAATRDGIVRVADLVTELGVSDMTIRRDLSALAGRGLVRKVYGGAQLVHGDLMDEPGFAAKSSRQQPEKTAIAQAAARMVEPGAAVGLTAGTTTWTLAPHLRAVPELTVVTNSVRVANELQRDTRADRTVVLTGGVRTPSDALVGTVAVNTLRGLHLDLVFLGVHGMHERAGFTTPNLLEADTNRAFVASASRVVTVADHTKWGIVGLCDIVSLDGVDTVVTDDGLPQDAREILGRHVGEVILAPVPDGAEAALS
ncbi:MAG: DeoR/GlpR family DNA-binding transcription regulator [Actinomycetota bacterium]|nr:DeoR/GlpR family DNA-binding transcription regulator [Actinomycetota bacterium]